MSIQNEILNAIASRRSCRAYKPEQITAEELEAVTTAGTWAATAMGRQSPVMVAVQDKETLAELSRLNAAVMGTQNDPFYGAPTAVLVLGEKNNPNGVQDVNGDGKVDTKDVLIEVSKAAKEVYHDAVDTIQQKAPEYTLY